MDRKDILLDGITQSMLGVEIGPWYNGLAPRRAGYRSLVLDVFDTPTLRRRAAADPAISEAEAALIEEVDLVGSAQELPALVRAKGLTGKIDYILSSHNIEHFPDLARFLQGCEEVLSSNGVLSLAIPDRRGIFDYFRPYSTPAEVIAAYCEKRRQPTPLQVFEYETMHCQRSVGGQMVRNWVYSLSPKGLHTIADVRSAYTHFRETISAVNPPYEDTHCWVFTPASFELIVSDLQFLGLIHLKLDKVYTPIGNEFYARFVKASKAEELPSRDEYDRRRSVLLQRIQTEYTEYGNLVWQTARERELEARIEGLLTSNSWKFTAPLRALVNKVRRLRGRLTNRLARR